MWKNLLAYVLLIFFEEFKEFFTKQWIKNIPAQRLLWPLFFPVFSSNLGKYGSETAPYLTTLHYTNTSLPTKMKFSIKDFFSKYDQIRSFLCRSYLLKKSLIGKLHFLCSAFQAMKWFLDGYKNEISPRFIKL